MDRQYVVIYEFRIQPRGPREGGKEMTDNTTYSAACAPAWGRAWLRAAAVYNVLWGAAVIVWPHALFDWVGIPRLNYPEIWQCVGMIVGVYGVGYWIAANDSRRHWPIVLVGLAGKILGPLGFAKALLDGVFPPAFGLTILTNDLVWWIPFALLLRDAARHSRAVGEAANRGAQ